MVYIFLADGFEDIEAMAPLDLLRRAGIDAATVGVTDSIVKSSHGVTVHSDVTAAELGNDVEMIVLPGGGLGTSNLSKSPAVHKALDYCAGNGIWVASICAAPSIPGSRGYLRGRRATCFPGFESYLDGASYTGEAVTVDGKFITAKSAGHALTFGLTLVEKLRGKEAADKVAQAIYQNN